MFNKKEINTGNQFEFDVAKSFAVIFMILIHTFEHMTDIKGTILPITVEFLGGAPAACIFMIAMGLGMVYTKHNSPKNFALRGITLLLMAYALNFFRETLPVLVGEILHIENRFDGESLLKTLANVDILHFAGIAFLFIALMKKLKIKPMVILSITILLNAIGSLCIGLFDGTPEVVQYLAGLFVFTNHDTAFPAFQWLIYPAVGMCFGLMLKHVSDKKAFYRILFISGIVSLISVTSGSISTGLDVSSFFNSDEYYMQKYITLLWCMSIVAVIIPLYYTVSCKIKGKIESGVKFISKNVNHIYIIQWLVIGYSIAIMELLDMNLLPSYWGIPVGLIITGFCILLCILWNIGKQTLSRNKN